MSEIYNNIIEFDELSSTNDYALELVRTESVPDFTVISTQFQTKGRGQIGNLWVSNKGENLLFSIILHPNHISANNQFILSQCVSLALRDFIAEYCNDVTIKWPNDIICKDKKLCGILCEKTSDRVVVGIGLNLKTEGFPNELKEIAIGLFDPFVTDRIEILKSIDQEQFYEHFVAETIALLNGLISEEEIKSEYLKRQYTLPEKA